MTPYVYGFKKNNFYSFKIKLNATFKITFINKNKDDAIHKIVNSCKILFFIVIELLLQHKLYLLLCLPQIIIALNIYWF